MKVLSTESQKRLKGYDTDISRYASYLDQMIEGVSATQGRLTIPVNGGTKEIDCVSIDTIAGFPGGYAIDIVPKKPSGRYYLDFIVYVPGKEKDEFEPNGKGPERVKVKFGNDIKKAIYKIFERQKGIENLTLRPLHFKKKRWPNIEARAEALEERRKKLKKRYEENENRLWFYYTTNLNEKPAFVVHIPQDPYYAVPLLKRLIGDIQYLGSRLSNK